jgi:hypothetical protein
MLPKSSLRYAFSNQLPLDPVSTALKNISFGLLSFIVPAQLVRGHLALLVPPPPHPIHKLPTEWKELVLGCFSIFQSSFSLHYHYSILRSSFFCFLDISKTDPYHSCPPPCRFELRADGVMVWVQTVWIDRLLSFFTPVLYYLLIHWR